ncbi:MAG: STAS domain-containing protein [Planctomycetota bacterium]|nr:STAS domain-containing protein [Planctomycetota bacterium]
MAEKGALQISTEMRGTSVVVSPVGEVGYHEAPTLRASLREAMDKKPARLVANLVGVHYMATPGLATLIEALQISKKTQVPLVLCGLTDRVRAVFEIARLQTVFKIVADVDAATAP